MTDFYCIYLRKIGLPVSIGIHDFEREAAQPMEFSIVLMLAPPSDANDDIRNVVDYDMVRETIIGLIEQGHWDLQESLCGAIGDTILDRGDVLGVIIRSAKTTVYPDTESVGCHLARLTPQMGSDFPWWTVNV